MSNQIIIKRRNGDGSPSSLAFGELAWSQDGASASDPQSSLFIGNNAGTTTEIVGKRLQVEMTGTQTGIAGAKEFTGAMTVTTAFSLGTGATDFAFPITKGTSGQHLAMNVGLTALEWATAAALAVKSSDIPGTGVIETDFNAVTDWSSEGDQTGTEFVVAAGEIWILSHDGTAYIWTGGTGTFGSGQTAAVNGDFESLGAATTFAAQSDFNSGTSSKAVDPAVGNLNYVPMLSTTGATAVKSMENNYLIAAGANFNIGVATGDGGVTTINRDITIGTAVTNPVDITAAGGTLQGTNLTTGILTLDNCEIDGGTY